MESFLAPPWQRPWSLLWPPWCVVYILNGRGNKCVPILSALRMIWGLPGVISDLARAGSIVLERWVRCPDVWRMRPILLRPRVLGVPSFELFFDFGVGALPEAREVKCFLHGSVIRRQNIEQDGCASFH